MKLRVKSASFEARYEALRIPGGKPPGADPLSFTILPGLMSLLSDPVEAGNWRR
jgi:hypothetical protein